jgi:hypothetical protein
MAAVILSQTPALTTFLSFHKYFPAFCCYCCWRKKISQETTLTKIYRPRIHSTAGWGWRLLLSIILRRKLFSDSIKNQKQENDNIILIIQLHFGLLLLVIILIKNAFMNNIFLIYSNYIIIIPRSKYTYW